MVDRGGRAEPVRAGQVPPKQPWASRVLDEMEEREFLARNYSHGPRPQEVEQAVSHLRRYVQYENIIQNNSRLEWARKVAQYKNKGDGRSVERPRAFIRAKYDEFQGSLDGYTFKRGTMGLGYYLDVHNPALRQQMNPRQRLAMNCGAEPPSGRDNIEISTSTRLRL